VKKGGKERDPGYKVGYTAVVVVVVVHVL